MNPAAEVWEKVVALMGEEMTATTLKTWFDDAEAVSLEESSFVLYSPTRLKRDIITARYIPPIQNALRELFSSDFQVLVLTENELAGYQKGAGSFLPGTEDYTFERFVVGSSNKFAHAAARAVADLRVLAELCLPFVKVGGWFLAMKGTDCGAELEQALPTIQALGGRAAEPFDYTIPHTEVAHRVVRIEKIGPSPSQYPRRWAKIQKEGQKKAP